LGQALEFEALETPSLQGFIHWLDQGEGEIKRETHALRNEVRIMTVHGAKGLQAPVVILADAHGVPSERLALVDVPLPDQRGVLPLYYGQSAYRVGVLEEAHEAEQSAQQQEYWRLLYVALTRAEDELYIAGHKSERGGTKEQATWYSHVVQALQSLPHAQQEDEFWGPGVLVHAAGSRAELFHPHAKEQEVPPAHNLPAWSLLAPMPEVEPTQPLTPSRVLIQDDSAGFTPDKARQIQRLRGQCLHSLLELLPQIAPDKRAQAGRAWLLAKAQLLGEAARAALLDEVLAVLNHEAFSQVFSQNSLAEVGVSAVIGSKVIAGRVDRLVVLPDYVLVLDYKSGPAPENIAQTPLAYLRQMAAYQQALQSIFPNRAIKAALLWTAKPWLMPLPTALLAQYY
jgi:ATP-dependent helicase/nuclease subunit A